MQSPSTGKSNDRFLLWERFARCAKRFLWYGPTLILARTSAQHPEFQRGSNATMIFSVLQPVRMAVGGLNAIQPRFQSQNKRGLAMSNRFLTAGCILIVVGVLAVALARVALCGAAQRVAWGCDTADPGTTREHC